MEQRISPQGWKFWEPTCGRGDVAPPSELQKKQREEQNLKRSDKDFIIHILILVRVYINFFFLF
jgi:hypothetical protein